MHAVFQGRGWMLTLGLAVAWIAAASQQVRAWQEPAPPAVTKPHAGMLRFPDISASHVVFSYAEALWTVPRAGGTATQLVTAPGSEAFPRFSPDGSSVAFMASYDGAQDLYAVPLAGGAPLRATYHPAAEILCDWAPTGKLLFYSNGLAGLGRQSQLFVVPPAGGLPEMLPIPYGANGALNADGTQLAYTPHTIDNRTWKRYRGGMATDIWVFNLTDRSARKITDFEGTDSQPMWHGTKVYYLSDAGDEHRLNVWSFDTASGAREQVTHAADYDLKWPAAGPGDAGQGEIIYQRGPALEVLDLTSRQTRTVEVLIPGDRPTTRAKQITVSNRVSGFDPAPTAKRVAFEARGDIWTVPVKHGPARNLTHTDGFAERDPAWSPDGKWIAFFCDATGEYELYVTNADGKGETKQLTQGGNCFRYSPSWSPDSKMLTFNDKTGTLFIVPAEGGEPKKIDQDPAANAGGIRVNWSADSTWLTYTRSLPNTLPAVFLYHVPTGQLHQATAGMFGDSNPTFDRQGKYLYFASNRRFASPIYEDVGSTFVYANTDVLLVVPLRKDVPAPWPAASDEEPVAAPMPSAPMPGAAPAPAAAGQPMPPVATPASPTGMQIDIEGFENRAILLPVPPGAFSGLAVTADNKLVYTRGTSRGIEGEPSIRMFDLADETRQEKTVVESGARGFGISADGKQLVVVGGGGPGGGGPGGGGPGFGQPRYFVVAAQPGQRLAEPIDLSGMTAMIDPAKEWRQIFTDAWRLQRDFFYDPNMHAVDWPAIRTQYEKMLADCTSRSDLDYIIGEMISELNVGHAYVRSGPPEANAGERDPRIGLLGADYELHEGAYRISKLYQGGSWDADARNPLSAGGVDVQQGQYLLAVNRVPVDVSKDPWAAFVGTAGKETILTVSDVPRVDDRAREVLVRPISSETDLRYRAWIEANRAYVEKRTEGKVGYIYVPNTGVDGQNDLFRQFMGQSRKQALIIDERWNGGGQIPTRFIELLNRPVVNYWARRDGADWVWPQDAHHGPKCMLINGLAGSGGDAFPAYFRQAGIGKLIGQRTWGGLVGISGNPAFVDGGAITAPTFAYYEKDGTWGIEGHGVDPDIDVLDDPSKMQNGADPQLDVAIDHILQEVAAHPYVAPARPGYPNRRGFGLTPEDK